MLFLLLCVLTIASAEFLTAYDDEVCTDKIYSYYGNYTVDRLLMERTRSNFSNWVKSLEEKWQNKLVLMLSVIVYHLILLCQYYYM